MNQLISMSDDDIMDAYYRYVPSSRTKKLNIYLRADLKDLKKLPSRPFIVLYETTPSNGHWVLVHDTIDATYAPCIEFFDSYGCAPDTQQKFISHQFDDLKDPTANLLRLLWNDTGGRVIFNDHKLQGSSTYTCGRHCMARLIGGNTDIDAYAARLRRIGKFLKLTPDEIVAFAIPPALLDESQNAIIEYGGCLACN